MSHQEDTPLAGPSTGPSVPKSGKKPETKRRRRAGGEGKKGKIFLEDKGQLLSLISSVTASKDAISQGKLEKQRAWTAEEGAETTEGGGSSERASARRALQQKADKGREKQRERARIMKDARAKVLDEARKKKRPKVPEPPATGKDDSHNMAKKKKSVGFA